MLAHTRYYNHGQNNTWLVWLHGLLGSQLDWRSVLPFFRDWPCLTVDLPGHGESVNVTVNSINRADQLLTDTINDNGIDRYVLIGYSLGGRIAMHHACYNESQALIGVAVEGGNPGLTSVDDKQHRILHDHLWANKFRQQPMEEVLTEWYKQPVFSDLTASQRQQLIALRKANRGDAIADMLEATSLGRQPWLAERLTEIQQSGAPRLCYLCGENDAKFQKIATDCGLPLKTVAQAGHNAHRSNPEQFSKQLISFLKEC
jgi:2-succinyl-6-hydroxy-2,4-cyclohexadiene-1-carboxylate synthase